MRKGNRHGCPSGRTNSAIAVVCHCNPFPEPVIVFRLPDIDAVAHAIKHPLSDLIFNFEGATIAHNRSTGFRRA